MESEIDRKRQNAFSMGSRRQFLPTLLLDSVKIVAARVCFIGVLAVLLTTCSPPSVDSSPNKTLDRADVTGTWTLRYQGRVISGNPGGQGFGVERLTLKADGSYDQSFDDGKGGEYPPNTGEWKLAMTHLAGRPGVR
jgi:hypothetical protein